MATFQHTPPNEQLIIWRRQVSIYTIYTRSSAIARNTPWSPWSLVGGGLFPTRVPLFPGHGPPTVDDKGSEVERLRRRIEAPGPDGVAGQSYLRHLGDRLRQLVYDCLRAKWFPECWKTGRPGPGPDEISGSCPGPTLKGRGAFCPTTPNRGRWAGCCLNWIGRGPPAEGNTLV